MTRRFKCETCRSRKIKCDETRPICKACSSADRLCHYRQNDQPVFWIDATKAVNHGQGFPRELVTGVVHSPSFTVNLQLRNSRILEGGHGCFQTLKPGNHFQKAKSTSSRQEALLRPRNALSTPTSSLVSRWSAVMGADSPASNPLSVFGPSIFTIPSRAGSHLVLDLALKYFLHSGETYRVGNDRPGTAVYTSRERAVRTLRHAISSQQINSHVLLAIQLHFVAELFVEAGSWNHRRHVDGLSHLLQSRIADGNAGEFEYRLIQATYLEEVTQAFLRGRDSILDGYFPKIEPFQSLTTFDLADLALIGDTIKLPRLARLVRACTTPPGQKPIIADATLTAKIVSLVEEFYCNATTSLVQEALGELPLTLTKTPEVARYFPQSYNFTSIETFTLSTRYHTFRILLCGILQTLLSLGIPCPYFHKRDIEQQDIDAATAIGMSTDYALTVKQAIPLVTLRIGMPLEWCFGAWYRLQERAEDSSVSMEAWDMQQWCIEMSNDIKRMWRTGTLTNEELRVLVDFISGGPVN